jgi:hypothetical protein
MHKGFMLIGVDEEREREFRPRNWAERIAGNLACYGKDRRLRFSDKLLPVMVNNRKYLKVGLSLNETHPGAYKEVMSFARINELTVDTHSVSANDEMLREAC